MDKLKEIGDRAENSLVHALLFQALAVVTTHPNYTNLTPHEALDRLERQASDPEFGGMYDPGKEEVSTPSVGTMWIELAYPGSRPRVMINDGYCVREMTSSDNVHR